MADYSAMSDRELDAAVAEKVFGWRWIHEDGEQPHAVPYLVGPGSSVYYPTVHAKFPNVPKSGGDLPNYSTDIAAAWKVVERMLNANPADSIARWRFDLRLIADQFFVSFNNRLGSDGSGAGHDPAKVTRAICLAALAAVEAKEGHDKHWEALEADHPPLSEPVRSQLIRHTRALGSDANKEK